ncbi:MAG TPA: hypothetical protein VFN35_06620 [Ktedonobacteraceae bacterium]|nr:hypothetical protein [Ktedonobacteraceae bacterium]
MAKTLAGATAFTSAGAPTNTLQAVARLRLVLGLVALLGAIVFLEGTSWDIQWHTFIGRDRTLIPPHIMMLGGVALSGLAGLFIVLIESWWVRRDKNVVPYTSGFAHIFAAPLGAYIVGYMALLAAVAFPLDAYWHTLFGIDVAIWAPFHIMFVASMGIVAFGAIYMLMSAAHLAGRAGAPGRGIKLMATVGAALAVATVLSLFTLLLYDAFQNENMIDLGFIRIGLFPLLSGLLVAFTLVAAASALPWRWAATCVSGFYLLLAGIMAVFVQPATDWLLTVEHLQYREQPSFTSAIALEWLLTPVVVAILVDIIMRRAQHKQWSRRKQGIFLSLTALLSGALPIMPIVPLLPLALMIEWGIAGSLISVLLGLVGAYLGTFFGRNVGEVLASLER